MRAILIVVLTVTGCLDDRTLRNLALDPEVVPRDGADVRLSFDGDLPATALVAVSGVGGPISVEGVVSPVRFHIGPALPGFGGEIDIEVFYPNHGVIGELITCRVDRDGVCL